MPEPTEQPDEAHNHSTEIVGPFHGDMYRVHVDGFLVPHIYCRPRPTPGEWEVVLDERLAFDFAEWQLKQSPMMSLLANAMAVSAGFSCFGENCREMNHFKVRVSGVGPRDDDSAPHGEAP